MAELGAFRVAHHQTLGSTNDTAMAALRAGDPGGLFVTAERQTGGRGRRGRGWASPPGNLYATLALRDPSSLTAAPQLGFVAGVALAQALRGLLGGDDRLRIKWPNDMLFAGAKLAGLLLESTTLEDGRLACVIGFGVNCLSHPEGLAYPTTDLSTASGASITPRTVLAALARTMEAELAAWNRGAGFPTIRERWLCLAAGLGGPISAVTSRETLNGIFRGVDSTGRLIIETSGRSVAIDACDVFLPGAVAGAMNEPNRDQKTVTPEGVAI